MITNRETTIFCDHTYTRTGTKCDENRVLPVGVESARVELIRDGWSHQDGEDFCPHHTAKPDPISHELKIVASAVFGEKLAAKTVAAGIAAENIASAIASAMWPADDQRELRHRFIGMCLDEVEIARD